MAHDSWVTNVYAYRAWTGKRLIVIEDVPRAPMSVDEATALRDQLTRAIQDHDPQAGGIFSNVDGEVL